MFGYAEGEIRGVFLSVCALGYLAGHARARSLLRKGRAERRRGASLVHASTEPQLARKCEQSVASAIRISTSNRRRQTRFHGPEYADLDNLVRFSTTDARRRGSGAISKHTTGYGNELGGDFK